MLVKVHLLTDTTFDFNRPNLLVNVEISMNFALEQALELFSLLVHVN